MALRFAHFTLLLFLLAACRERAVTKPSAAAVPCSQVGQRCEVSPGKLGSCVQRDDCREQNCFVCQSQH